jgi:hypothetical protein
MVDRGGGPSHRDPNCTSLRAVAACFTGGEVAQHGLAGQSGVVCAGCIPYPRQQVRAPLFWPCEARPVQWRPLCCSWSPGLWGVCMHASLARLCTRVASPCSSVHYRVPTATTAADAADFACSVGMCPRRGVFVARDAQRAHVQQHRARRGLRDELQPFTRVAGEQESLRCSKRSQPVGVSSRVYGKRPVCESTE